MSITYENQRVNFDRVVRRYKEYIELYKQFTGGTVEGATPFHQFYWQMTWLARYDGESAIGHQGY